MFAQATSRNMHAFRLMRDLSNIKDKTYRDSPQFKRLYQVAENYQKTVLSEIMSLPKRGVSEEEYSKILTELKSAAEGYLSYKLGKEKATEFITKALSGNLPESEVNHLKGNQTKEKVSVSLDLLRQLSQSSKQQPVQKPPVTKPVEMQKHSAHWGARNQ